jgi:hypothetical protein
MGMVLRFNPRPTRQVQVASGPAIGQVILFTGVRYDRARTGTTTQPSRRKRKG